jgi:hypothetical protein
MRRADVTAPASAMKIARGHRVTIAPVLITAAKISGHTR